MVEKELFRFKGYLIVYYGPSDERFTYRIKLRRNEIKDMNKLVDFFERYESELSRIAKVFDETVFGEYARKDFPEFRKYIKIMRNYVLEITVTTPTIYYLLHKLKSNFANVLRNELFYIEAKPMYVYISTESKLKEIYKLKKEIDSSLEALNKIYGEFQKIFIKRVNEILKNCGISVQLGLNEKFITPISMKVVPIDIDISELGRIDPEVSNILVENLKSHIIGIVVNIFKRYEEKLKDLVEKRYVNIDLLKRSISDVKNYLDELGVYRIVEPIFNEIDEIIAEPSRFILKYGNFEDWKNRKLEEVSNKLIELVETRRLN